MPTERPRGSVSGQCTGKGHKHGSGKVRDGCKHRRRGFLAASIQLKCQAVRGRELGVGLGSLGLGTSLEGSGRRLRVQSSRRGAGRGCGRAVWLHVSPPSQDREAATCSMKLARLMSLSDKPVHSWVLKVM